MTPFGTRASSVIVHSHCCNVTFVVAMSACFHFSEPNDESAANVDAAKVWREDRVKFNELAQRTVRKSLGL